jgi:hypothetical protein
MLLLLQILSVAALIVDVRVVVVAAAAPSADRNIIRHRQNQIIGMAAAASAANPLFVRGGGGGTSSRQIIPPAASAVAYNHATTNDDNLRAKTLTTLLQTSFLIAASVSMVMFSPLPSITRHLANSNNNNNNNNNLMKSSSSSLPLLHPEARAIQLLSILSSTSASIELLLSPFVGSLVDSPLLGRKCSSIILHACIACGNLCVVLHPGVTSICLSRMVNVVAGGFLVIVTNTVIADVFAFKPSPPSLSSQTTRTSSSSSSTSGSNNNEQMGSVLGKQAAYASLGFLLGSVVGGRLTEYGERVAYGTALVLSVLATANVVFRMEESLEIGNTRSSSSGGGGTTRIKDTEEKVIHDDVILPSLKDGYWEKPLSSIRLFYQYGSHMRTLALLLLLQSAPMFMGDVFQMFAKEEWGLHPKDFSNLVGK